MFDMKQMAINLIQKNPAIANSPQGKNFLQILQSGDSKQGEEFANNILNSYGLTKEQAMQDITKNLNIPM